MSMIDEYRRCGDPTVEVREALDAPEVCDDNGGDENGCHRHEADGKSKALGAAHACAKVNQARHGFRAEGTAAAWWESITKQGAQRKTPTLKLDGRSGRAR